MPMHLSEETLAPIRTIFFQECEDLLAELESGLLALQGGARDGEVIDAVFRSVHSIKGSAGAFAFAELVRFSHAFEAALAAVRARTAALEPELLKLLLRAADVLADQVHAARTGEADAAPAETDALIQALDAVGPPRTRRIEGDDGFADLEFSPRPVGLDLQRRRWTIRFKPHASLYLRANDPLRLLRELQLLGEMSVALDQAALPPLDRLAPEEAYLAWAVELFTEADEAAIADIFAFVEGDCELSIELAAVPAGDEPAEAEPTALADKAAVGPPEPGRTIRVDLERLDRLVNLVGELAINQSMLSQRLMDAGLGASAGVRLPLDDLDHLTRDLQDSVMAMRAQPVKAVFRRMSRLVRELEGATGKRVQLVTSGEDTEVDRTIIERLTDPLTHMVRNAIGHGIGTPAERAAAGKPETGVVRISAAHRGGRIVVEVSDDGRGIDRQAVFRVAVRRGLIAPDAALNDDEVDNLIFTPGFSTAAEPSQLSGRGVGMDVVMRGVQALGGRIAVASRPGQGARITLSLPLTLAVLDGMLIGVAGHRLVAPVANLIEAVRPRAADVHRLGPRDRLLSYRDQRLPLFDLGMVLGYRQTAVADGEGVAMVVEDDHGVRTALVADEVLGQRQVVIKSVEANYRAVPGVAAATILGDGSVALILDVTALTHSERARDAHRVVAMA